MNLFKNLTAYISILLAASLASNLADAQSNLADDISAQFAQAGQYSTLPGMVQMRHLGCSVSILIPSKNYDPNKTLVHAYSSGHCYNPQQHNGMSPQSQETGIVFVHSNTSENGIPITLQLVYSNFLIYGQSDFTFPGSIKLYKENDLLIYRSNKTYAQLFASSPYMHEGNLKTISSVRSSSPNLTLYTSLFQTNFHLQVTNQGEQYISIPNPLHKRGEGLSGGLLIDSYTNEAIGILSSISIANTAANKNTYGVYQDLSILNQCFDQNGNVDPNLQNCNLDSISNFPTAQTTQIAMPVVPPTTTTPNCNHLNTSGNSTAYYNCLNGHAPAAPRQAPTSYQPPATTAPNCSHLNTSGNSTAYLNCINGYGATSQSQAYTQQQQAGQSAYTLFMNTGSTPQPVQQQPTYQQPNYQPQQNNSSNRKCLQEDFFFNCVKWSN